jgi:hypothetical protein
MLAAFYASGPNRNDQAVCGTSNYDSKPKRKSLVAELRSRTTTPGEEELSDLGGTGLLEANHFTEFLVPMPKHEGQGRQRRSNAQKRGEEKKTQKDQIDDSSCHLNTLRIKQ